MTNGMYRIGIVGASSLVGKELSDELGESLLGASDFILLDDDEAAGKITATGNEAAFIQRLDASSFDRMDFVFFAGSAEVTRKHWQSARKAGASIVDLTYALEEEKGVVARAPWVGDTLASQAKQNGRELGLDTPAVVAGHPAAVMLALVAARLRANLQLKSIAATVMEPASENGRRGPLHGIGNPRAERRYPQPYPRRQDPPDLFDDADRSGKIRYADFQSGAGESLSRASDHT